MARRVLLAMPDDEANRLGAPLQHALDGIGHLAQIHCVLDLRAAAFGLDNDGIIHFHAVFARCGELGVEVERANSETRVLVAHYCKYLFCRIGVIIFVVVEIGQHHVVL